MSEEGSLIDSHVSQSQCRKAVEALHSHELKKKEKFEENQILPAKEQHVWLNVTVKHVAPTHKVKPLKMYLLDCRNQRSNAD
jgi:ribosome biogenesis protein UTP30